MLIHKISPANNETITSAIQIMGEAIKVCDLVQEEYPTGEYPKEIFIKINFLERFSNSLSTLSLLLIEYKKTPVVETSIGLILRACLLDFMTITYLSSYMAELKPSESGEGSKYEQELDALLADQVSNTFKYLKTLRDVNFISESERTETIKSLWHNYNYLFTCDEPDFENPSSKLNSTKFITPVIMFKRINESKLTRKFSQVYDLYTYYSKYEHFGVMTHFLQRRGSANDLENMIAGIKYIMKGIGASLAYLQGNKPKVIQLMKDFDKIETEFWSLEINP